jgi:hypothetical protein
MKYRARFTLSLAVLLLTSLVGSTPAGSETLASRLAGDWRSVTPIAASKPPVPFAAVDQGAAPGSARLERMLLLLQPSAAQQQALATELAAQQNVSSAEYHRWITPQAFADSYANSASDVAAVAAWLSSQGFQVAALPAGRGWIEFSGTVAQVEQAFSTQVDLVTVDGLSRAMLTGSISVPVAMQPLVKGLVSLDGSISTAALTAPRAVNASAAALAAQSSPNQVEALTPRMVAQLLHWDALNTAGVTGAGQSIAIATRSNVLPGDVAAFRSTFGLPASSLAILPSGADPGLTDDETAAVLAASWAGAAAPGAQIVLVPAATTAATDGLDLSLAAIVDQQLAQTVAVGYSDCEASLSAAHQAFYAALYQQAAAEGISIIAATGDSGASACQAAGGSAAVSSGYGVNALASTPWNTAVGTASFGTSGAAGGATSLAAWSPASASDPGYASGGGNSLLYARPSWQPATASGVHADVVSATALSSGFRLLPDLALPTAMDSGANPGLAFCLSASNTSTGCTLVRSGGSSASAALFAGIAALVAQKDGAQGNLNATLYSLRNTSGVYADVTEGSAQLTCVAGSAGCSETQQIGYSAATGYDLATGLGAVNAQALVNNWARAMATTTAYTPTVTSSFTSGTATPFSFTGSIPVYATVDALAYSVGVSSYEPLVGNVQFYAYLAPAAPPSGTASYTSGAYAIDVTYPNTTVGSAEYMSATTSTLNIPPCSLAVSANQYNLYGEFTDTTAGQYYGPSTSYLNLPFYVDAATTTTKFSSSNINTTTAGTAISLSALVAASDTTSPVTGNAACVINAGTVVFTDATTGTTLGSATVSSGSATATLAPFTALGSHTINAVFTPSNGNWQSSKNTDALSSSTQSVYVNAGATTVSLASNLSGSTTTTGSSVILTATVYPTSSSLTSWSTIAGGTVSFQDNGTTMGTGTVSCTTGTNCTATYTAVPTAAGSNVFTAVYGANGIWAASSASSSTNTVTVTVAAGTPTVTVTATPASVAYGSAVSITAALTATTTATYTMNGTVKFYADYGTASQVLLGSASVAGNAATLSTSVITGGAHTISASFTTSDTNWASTTATSSVSASVTVTTAASVTTLTATPTALTAGAVSTSVTLTAALTPASTTVTTYSLTGTVIFYDGTTKLGSVPVASNSATLTVKLSNSVNHSITAVYSGDTNWVASTSTAVVLDATILPVTIVLTSNLTTAGTEQAVVLTATVTPTSTPATGSEQNPSGTVIFYDGTTVIGSATLVASTGYSSVATLTISTLPGGNDTITAVYGGDTAYATATSNAVTVEVQDFSITASASNPATNLVIVQGSSGTASFALTALGGYAQEIQVVCSVPSQDDMTCTASPQQIYAPGTVTFSVATFTSGSTAKNHSFWPPVAGGTALALLGFFLLPFGKRARLLVDRSAGERGRRFVVLLLLLVGLSATGVGCTSSVSGTNGTGGTPLGVATLTITASAYVNNVVVGHSVYLTVDVVAK